MAEENVVPLTSDNDSWLQAVSLFTGYAAPARDGLFNSLIGNDGIPQMKVEITKQGSVTYVDVDDLNWMVENSGWRIENTDFVIPFYATSGDTASAGDQVSMYKARFTLLGNKSGDGPPAGGVVEGGEFKSQYENHLGLSGDKATWSTEALTQYSYGTGRALEALLYNDHGTHGFSWNGKNVVNDQAVSLASFDTAADAFDRVAQFFVDRKNAVEEWERRIGVEENDAWRGQAAGVFWNLVHTLSKQYAGYAKDMRPGSTGSKQGDEIRAAKDDFRKAVVELHRRWMDWELYMGNPLRWLHDLLKEIADHVWEHNIKQITYKVNSTGGYYTSSYYTTYHTTGAFSQNAFRLGKPDDFGPLDETSTWKKVGERAIENWQASVVENLVKPADEALKLVHNSWSTKNFDLGSIRTRGGGDLSSSYADDKAEKDADKAKADADAAEKKQDDFIQWQKDQAAAAAAAAAAAKKEQEEKEAAAKKEQEEKEAAAKKEQEEKEAEAKAEQERRDKEQAEKEATAKAEQEQKEHEQEQKQEEAEKKQEAKEAELKAEQERKEQEQEQKQEEAEKKQEEAQARQEQMQIMQMNQAKAEQEKAKKEQEAKEAEQEAKQEAKEAEQEAKQEAKEAEQEAKENRLRAEQEQKQAEAEKKQEAKEAELKAEQERKEKEQEAKQDEAEKEQRQLRAEQEQKQEQKEAEQEQKQAEAEQKQDRLRAEQEQKQEQKEAEQEQKQAEAEAKQEAKEKEREEAQKQAEAEYERQRETALNGGDLSSLAPPTISGPVYQGSDLPGSDIGVPHLDPDGRVVTDYPDGSRTTIDPDTHTATVTRPDGSSISGPLNSGDSLHNPDGSVSHLDPRGQVVTEFPDGSTSTLDPSTGATTHTYPDGTTTSGYLNGGGDGPASYDVPSYGSSSHDSSSYGSPSYEEELYDDLPYESPYDRPSLAASGLSAAPMTGTPLNTGSLPGSGAGGAPAGGMPMGGMPMGGGMGGGGGAQGQSTSERVRNVIDGGQVVSNRGSRGSTGTAGASPRYRDAEAATRTGTTGGSPYPAPMGGGGAPGQQATQSGDRARDAWVQEEEDVWGTDEGGAPAVIGR
ncbi:AAWKG family protein [Streptomyces sp. AK02-01A]|uniref:AAWKG family protein n=1 Tax=Streptomyces sp. AK02-01A TaxID=3028648 RepID=UPI0029B9E187|nr:AAWKG family protein [Streptomyces sp. AK02-01A]MDX3850296.1 AAWKG family protein [Streptomyces sp. AK02-01A]